MILTVEQIQKYLKVTTPNLKLRAIKVFNAFIRERDKDEPCISCGSFKALQAGHYHSAGKHNHMRFLPDNVNGQCLKCNYYDGSNALKYRIGLVNKIGLERVEKLDRMAMDKSAHPDNRMLFIEILQKYRN